MNLCNNLAVQWAAKNVNEQATSMSRPNISHKPSYILIVKFVCKRPVCLIVVQQLLPTVLKMTVWKPLFQKEEIQEVHKEKEEIIQLQMVVEKSELV